MARDITVDRVEMKAADPDTAKTGLLGWVSCRLNGNLQLGGIALRRTLEGRLTLSFPAKRDRTGQQWYYIRPLDSSTRRAIERQVFSALGVCA